MKSFNHLTIYWTQSNVNTSTDEENRTVMLRVR